MSHEQGIITLWFGAIVNIPDGWILCDGNNDTPDLRDRIPIGAGLTYPVDDTGGTVNHTHTGTTDGHLHQIGGPPNNLQPGAGFDDESLSNTDTFTTAAGNNLPPYHALAYIMKT